MENNFSIFFSFWHSDCLNQGRHGEAGKHCSACSVVYGAGDVWMSSLFVLSVHP